MKEETPIWKVTELADGRNACMGKHTKYNPSDEEWKCPKCGVGASYKRPDGMEESGFIIESFDDDHVDPDCPDLHDDDNLFCYKCNFTCSGKAFAAKVVKAKNLIPCPCCKGRGMVPAGKGVKPKVKKAK